MKPISWIHLVPQARTFAICALIAWPLGAAAVDVEEVVAAHSLTESQLVLVSQSGTEILSLVADARADIAKRDGTQARRKVARARALVGEIRAMSPTVRAEHQISGTLGKIRQQKAGVDDLLPIYQEIDTVVEREAIADIRVHVDNAKGHLQAATPHWREAADELMMASTKIAYTEIDLPIHDTYARLSRAHLYLRRNELPNADAALEDVVGHVKAFVAVASETEVEEVEAVVEGN